MIILCLDIGSKRIGVAKSDELEIAAHPLTVIERKGNAGDCARIVDLIREHGAERLVVGVPFDQEGGVGDSAKKVLGFINVIKQALVNSKLDIHVETWDERYSTSEAEELLIDADLSRAKRKKIIDKMAAARILQSYMENNKS
jgi:putative Holliday junction resolvase